MNGFRIFNSHIRNKDICNGRVPMLTEFLNYFFFSVVRVECRALALSYTSSPVLLNSMGWACAYDPPASTFQSAGIAGM